VPLLFDSNDLRDRLIFYRVASLSPDNYSGISRRRQEAEIASDNIMLRKSVSTQKRMVAPLVTTWD
jgi:hypothetical protein